MCIDCVVLVTDQPTVLLSFMASLCDKERKRGDYNALMCDQIRYN